ncbi:hypothetical protein KAT08_04695 [Candidatus Babeliales bacterium]|nr:hypothetical protein [Candidatus Babeliales bacterium]
MPTSFSLSLELVLLMNWLLKNEKTKLKFLIEDTIKNGFLKELEKIDQLENNSFEINKLHASILDFMIYLEDILLDTLEKKDLNFQAKEKLTTALEQVNPQNMDLKTVWQSVQQAKNLVIKQTNQKNSNDNKFSNEEIKKTLFFQLLKNWNPRSNEPVN